MQLDTTLLCKQGRTADRFQPSSAMSVELCDSDDDVVATADAPAPQKPSAPVPAKASACTGEGGEEAEQRGGAAVALWMDSEGIQIQEGSVSRSAGSLYFDLPTMLYLLL